MDSRGEDDEIRYLAFSSDPSGNPKVTVQEAPLRYSLELPEGYAAIETLQAGACASEVLYYRRQAGDAPSRFEQDRENKVKQEYYLDRNMRTGVVSVSENISAFRKLLQQSMFHEAVSRITATHPDTRRKKIPVQKYVPRVSASGEVSFVKEIIQTNMQENFEIGALAVRNPILLCDEHSRADNINPETGWPYQCHRRSDAGHMPKGAMGHTECIGAAVDGRVRVPLDTLTPLSPDLQQFVKGDPAKRACLLTAVEPMACIFDAFGTMLQSGERPGSIVIIGDGWSALNTICFFQVFAPHARIIVVGRYPEKLAALRRIHPDTITTLVINSEDYSDLDTALRQTDERSQADLLMITVPLREECVSRFVRDNGLIIWWAGSISAFAEKTTVPKRYRERFPFGGAPRAELSAAELFDYLVRERPDVVSAFLEYPGTYCVDMGDAAANDVQKWLEHEGNLHKNIFTPDGPLDMSVKLVINMRPLYGNI